jgi:hypothetical protein
LARALEALRLWRQVLIEATDSASCPTSEFVSLQETVHDAIDNLGERVIAIAEGLYCSGKGKHIWNNDDEEKFIEALVNLDSQRVDLLSSAVRARHAVVWQKCLSELSDAQREDYKRRSAITNGRNPAQAM